MQNFIIIILIMFSIIMTILYWIEVSDKDRYMRDKEIILNQKDLDLIFRENNIIDKEICMKEVSRLKNVQTNILKMIGDPVDYPIKITSEEAKK
jgi:hypothetical protein